MKKYRIDKEMSLITFYYDEILISFFIFEHYVKFIVIFTISGKMGLSCVKIGHTIRKTGSNRSGESGYSGI